MREKVLAKLGIRGSDETGSTLASRLKFSEQLIVRPTTCRRQTLRTLDTRGARCDLLKKSLVPALVRVGFRRVGCSLHRLLHRAKDEALDHDDVFAAFSDRPCRGRRSEL